MFGRLKGAITRSLAQGPQGSQQDTGTTESGLLVEQMADRLQTQPFQHADLQPQAPCQVGGQAGEQPLQPHAAASTPCQGQEGVGGQPPHVVLQPLERVAAACAPTPRHTRAKAKAESLQWVSLQRI